MDLSDPWSPLVPAAPGTVFRANHHSPICHLQRHGTCLASSASPSILALEISLLLLLESSHPFQPSLIFSTLTIFTIPCNNRGGGRLGAVPWGSPQFALQSPMGHAQAGREQALSFLHGILNPHPSCGLWNWGLPCHHHPCRPPGAQCSSAP